jgi:hypothetical protein
MPVLVGEATPGSLDAIMDVMDVEDLAEWSMAAETASARVWVMTWR